jgi:hypothetical protein
LQQPFNGYWRTSLDVEIEQAAGTDVLLMPTSVAESRFIDSVDDKSDDPRRILAHEEEEIVPPISELAISRIRYCGEFAPLLRRDVHDLMEEQII